MSLRTFNDPILSQVCDPVTAEDQVGELIHKMVTELMKHKSGVGLAAPQVGIKKRIILVRPTRDSATMVMVNPVITLGDKFQSATEGCLSYPGVQAQVARATTVIATWFDDRWKEHTQAFSGWHARIIQHEVDHLNGICKVGDAWRPLKPPPKAKP